MIALRQAQRAGLLQPDQWLPNVVAGVVVGVVALPPSRPPPPPSVTAAATSPAPA